MRTMIVVLLICAVAGPAAAQSVTVTGAPAADRDAIVGSLEKARGLMAVCWARKAPEKVRVTLAVAASGEVTRAVAKTKGPAAQCAAGILAVSTLAPSAKAWKGTVDVKTAAPGKADDVRAIHDQLAENAPAFFDCQKKAPAFAGKILLRVTVEQGGTVSAAAGDVVEGSAKSGAAVGACAAAVARPLRLRPLQSPSVTYELSLDYKGGGSAGGATAPRGGDPALKPSKKGPLGDGEVTSVINGKRAALVKCAKGSKARGKVVIRVAIAANGKPAVKIKSSEIADTKVEACLLKVFQSMTFGASSGETVVHYPVRLDADVLKTGT